MRTIWLDEVDSTNSWLDREAAGLDDPVMVVARSQTAGHGQRGNGWESAPGENLTLSVLWRPENFRAADQFAISEATALAVVDFLAVHGIEAKVKWPNDVYVADGKICGILIRHALSGNEISHSILGIGINVNQTRFVSDAPNPVSMSMISGESYDVALLAGELAGCIGRRLSCIYGAARQTLHEEFLRHLWRADGAFYPFRDAESGEFFEAAVSDVDTQGVLCLSLRDAGRRYYRFKEVAFLL